MQRLIFSRLMLCLLGCLTAMLLTAWAACATRTAAPLFAEAASDKLALDIADKVMQAHGGSRNWQKARYVGWQLFKQRYWLWDKKLDRVRMESCNKEFLVVLNRKDTTGFVKKDGQLLTQPDSIKKYLTLTAGIWALDAPWFLLPFQLKDNHASLHYKEEITNGDGKQHRLQLRYNDKAALPNVMYDIWVHTTTHRIVRWDYYSKPTRPRGDFSTIWKEYAPFGKIWLATDRGQFGKMTHILVSPTYAETLFTSKEFVNVKNQ